MNNLSLFTFNTKDIRVIQKDGQPWFIAKDVAEILEIGNARESIRAFPPSEKDVITTDTLGGPQKTTVISEPGLYRLIFQSRKKEAEEFKTWVVTEVLPQIRKTGSYQKELSLEEQALKVITGLSAKVEEQRKALEEAQPKVEFYDTIVEGEKCFNMSETVKLLKLTIGRNKFYTLLKADRILQNDREPYQHYVSEGYFKVTLKQVGHGGVEKVALVTGKGLAWLQKRYDHIRLKEVV